MSVQETLQDEHTKIARVENAVTRVVGKEIYQADMSPWGALVLFVKTKMRHSSYVLTTSS